MRNDAPGSDRCRSLASSDDSVATARPPSTNGGLAAAERRGYICLVEGLKVVRATEGSTEHSPLVSGVETAKWDHCSKVGGQVGVLEAAERLMVTWRKDEAELSRQRHASVVGGYPGEWEGGGSSREETAADGSRKETADRV